MLLQADRAIDGLVFGRAKFAVADSAALVAQTGMRQRVRPQEAANDVGSDAVEVHLDEREAAVAVDRLAGDKAGVVRSQEAATPTRSCGVS